MLVMRVYSGADEASVAFLRALVVCCVVLLWLLLLLLLLLLLRVSAI